jgi:methyltransferase (TIGR00027 family)
MKRSQASITSEGIALARAIETARPAASRICSDPYAHLLITPLFYLAGRLMANYGRLRSPGVMEYLAVRTRTIDDLLTAKLTEGMQQLVILGAGLDSRAYRFRLPECGVRAFEVDHPASQAVKLERLKRIFDPLPAHVTYVPVDFTTQKLSARLAEAGYDERLKTFFIWEGVVYYLPLEAVDETLAFIARHSPPGSSLVFDYMDETALAGRGSRNEIRSMQRYRRITGEGLVFGIPRGGAAGFLESRGFCDIVDWDAGQLTERYLSGHGDRHPVPSIYSIAAAAVA